jgi:hypothetical protein
LLGWLGMDDISARDLKKKCKKKSGDAKKKCLKKAKKHAAEHASETSPAPPPAATCSDGIQNQGEADIDCGGPCARCVNGKNCSKRADCASAYCNLDGKCAACSLETDCPDSVAGDCVCGTGSASGRCYQNTGGASTAPSCAQCPPNTGRCAAGPTIVTCYKLCGAV